MATHSASGQLTWMLCLKVFDEQERNGKLRPRRAVQPIPRGLTDEYRWRNWASFVPGADGSKPPKKPATEIIGFVNDRSFPKSSKNVMKLTRRRCAR